MSEGKISLWLPEPDLIIHQALGKLAEETAELSKVVARCLIQGIDAADPETGKTNRAALIEEAADVDAATDWLMSVAKLDAGDIGRRDRKCEGFSRWQKMLEEHLKTQPIATAASTDANAADELHRHWISFCDADPFEGSDTFANRMEAAGLLALVAVTKEALEDPFAADRGLEKGGMMYVLTEAGRTALGIGCAGRAPVAEEEIPGKLEYFEGRLTTVVDASRTGHWRFHEHYDRDGYCDNPGRGY